jgi:hypothetical protein
MTHTRAGLARTAWVRGPSAATPGGDDASFFCWLRGPRVIPVRLTHLWRFPTVTPTAGGIAWQHCAPEGSELSYRGAALVP